MQFPELISPMPENEFMERFHRDETFVIQGNKEKFSGLITLDDIEHKLNEGCNTNMPIQLIQDGVRKPLIDQNVAWSPFAVKKSEVKKLLEDKHSFMMMNMSQINRKVAELIDGIEAHFDDMCADLHLYVSPMGQATAYNAHRDRPQHKIYLQVVGETTWQIFSLKQPIGEKATAITDAGEEKFLKVEKEFTLTPGDLLYMPPNVFHKVRNYAGPRISFSIPFKPNVANNNKMDRSYIPFKSIFEAANS